MNILGIETSCDETSVALLEVLRGKAEVVKEITASQVLTHAKYGGVVPEVAARMHVETLPVIIKKMKIDPKTLDGIAVTRGPGLITSLRVGVDFARGLAYGWDKPIVGVNHIEGHIAANWIGKKKDAFKFPAVALVVSGGHTELILMKSFGKYERLGATLDDAAGEAFDKVAKMLGLGYPGGPEVSRHAEKGDSTVFDLPRPMINKKNFDFSFSGLKTAVLYTIKGKKKWNSQDINDLCASFQEAAVTVLVKKTVRAALEHRAKTVFLAGGVSANKHLRKNMKSEVARSIGDGVCVLPDMKYTTDNAAMIAMAGYFRLSKDPSTSLGMTKEGFGMIKGENGIMKMEPDPNWELGAAI